MKKLLRVLRAVGIGFVTLVLVATAAVYGVTTMQLNRTVDFQPKRLAGVHADSATVARGAHLATAIAKCAECHGDDMAGKTFAEVGPVFKLYGPNLTRGTGGIAASLTDQDWSNAIRHGVRRDGRSLLFMPSEDWVGMSDEDVSAIVAYMKQLPAVDNVVPQSSVGPVGRVLMLAGKLPLFSAQKVKEAPAPGAVPPAGPTAAYGRYLANVGGCTGCHGPTLSGGRIPGAPPDLPIPANITPAGIGGYTRDDFARALREGTRPDGSAINDFMPIKWTKLMTDDEISAVYAYLQTVPAKEFGTR
ncbi:MAG: c-type cytochrome [Gemmatimonadaceae bacterium]